MTLLRFDFAEIGRVEMTATGAMRIPAVLSRVGVTRYMLNGQERRELRPPDEVLRADSMATLSGAIATDLHPPRAEAWITPANWKKWAVGYVGEHVRQDGNLVRGTVVVQDDAMIAMIREGKRRELSPGYKVLRFEATPGRWDGKEYGPHVKTGESYDGIQRNIVYNSIGIGPRGFGRQGSEVALRLDSGDTESALMRFDGTQLGDFLRAKMLEKQLSVIDVAEATGIILPKPPEEDPLLRSGPVSSRTWVLESILDGWTERPSNEQLTALARVLDVEFDTLIQMLPVELRKLDGKTTLDLGPREKLRMDTIEIRLDGITITMPKAAHEVVQKVLTEKDKAIADRTAELETLRKQNSELQARYDGEVDAHGKTKTKLEQQPAQIRAELASRAALETSCRRVLGSDVRFDGKTDRELREQVIAKLAPKAVIEGKDDTYVLVRFDSLMEDFKEPDAGVRARETIFGGPNPPKVRQDGKGDNEPDPAAARAKMIERNQNAWLPPQAKT